jgi:hypothetical protein
MMHAAFRLMKAIGLRLLRDLRGNVRLLREMAPFLMDWGEAHSFARLFASDFQPPSPGGQSSCARRFPRSSRTEMREDLTGDVEAGLVI